MDLDLREIKRLINASDTKWSDARTNKIPAPADLLIDLPPLDDSCVVQIPLELPLDEGHYIKEELPDSEEKPLEARGIWTIDLLGD
jgi:hypothetical protein